jgi:hypothetical protein
MNASSSPHLPSPYRLEMNILISLILDPLLSTNTELNKLLINVNKYNSFHTILSSPSAMMIVYLLVCQPIFCKLL